MKWRTRKTLALGVVALLVVAVLTSTQWYLRRRDAAAEATIRRTVPLLDAFRKNHGRYPERLAELPGFGKARHRVLLVFPGPRVFYHPRPEGYRLDYYQSPLGPFHGYDSNSGEWYFEE